MDNNFMEPISELEKKDWHIAELNEIIKSLKSTCIDLSKQVVYTEKEKEDYWEIDCECGFKGLSLFALGGNQIADTGDYDDCHCPCCGSVLD